MVFESRVGETFLLGASSWRIEEITHDRVLVSPAPGQPGKMPFWKADAAGRPLELGRHIGELVRSLRQMPPAAAIQRLTKHHDLDARAAENLLRYLADQAAATGAVPDDRTIVIERTRDELGDWRICLLSPFGGRIHAPWAMAVVERVRAETGGDVETMWTDDGFVVRFPETEDAARSRAAAARVGRGRGARRAAARRHGALRGEVPRGGGARAAPAAPAAGRPHAALAAAEARGRSARGRGAVRIVSDDPRGLPRDPARRVRHAGARRHAAADRRHATSAPSPSTRRCRRRSRRRCSSATSPTTSTTATRRWPSAARRRCRSIRRSCASCSARPSCASCSTPTRWPTSSAQLQQLDERYRARSADGVHDLLLHLGDLTRGRDRRAIDRRRRRAPSTRSRAIAGILPVRVGRDSSARTARAIGSSRSSTPRAIATRSACRCRRDCPSRCSSRRRDAALDLARRYARTHGPFTTAEFAARYGLGRSDRARRC